MKIDRNERNLQEFTGQVKFSKLLGIGGDCKQWRTGKIVLEQRESDWKLEVHLDVKDKSAALTLYIHPNTIQTCTCTDAGGFMLKAYQSQTLRESVVVNFKPDRKTVSTRALKAISHEMKGRHTEAPALRSEVGLSNTNIVNTPSRKALFTTVDNTADNSRSDVKQENRNTESPQRFTSVKENIRNHTEDDMIDTDYKENINSTPYRSSGEKFLHRGLDKSRQRQNLEALGAKTFYSSTAQQNSSTTAGVWLNSGAKRPGLMPNPTPSKKPRLSNSISYSMKARATAEEQKQPQILQGFSNLGNTCYMNAILQSLFGLDTFTADLLTANRKLMRTLSPQSLYYSLAKLVHSRKRNLSDDCRRELLRNVKGAISVSAKRFSGYGQHDAHEFLGQVLDQLKEEILKINKSTPSPSRDPAEENAAETDHVNPTTVNFEFEVMHTITCLQCREDVSKVEQFHDVSVDLPKRKDLLTPRSLQDSLSIFFRKEDIEYTCEKCGHNKSEVTHKFTRLPRVFIIHLKRYSYDQTFLRNTKMAQCVRIPSYLTLQSHCAETTQPAFPVQLQHVSQSRETNISLFEEKKEETPKRRLDFPGYTFNRKGLTPSAAANGNINGNNSTVPETVNQEKKQETEGANLLKPLSEEEDPELARAIEMSLKDQEERNQLTRDFGEDNDSNFQKVLEMSRHEEQSETKPNVEELTEEQQIELAMQMSLMETDPYHHSNYTSNDDVMSSFGDHAYAESYDIGPDVKNDGNVTWKEDVVKTSLRTINGSSNVAGVDSKHVTTETDDIIKTCSKAVMSSDDQPISPGVLSDSESEVLELFHESDGSQKLTKIEDRNRNNNFANQKPCTSKYFSQVKADNVFENENPEVDRNSEDKLPGGGKNDLKTSWNGGQTEDQETGSSDTDDFELAIETESEYKRNTNTWYDKSLKSYSKLENRTVNKVFKERNKCSVKSEMDLELSERKRSKCLKQEIQDSQNKTSHNETETHSVDKTENCSSSRVDSNGQYIRKCQLETPNKTEIRKHSMPETEVDNLEIYLNSEADLLESKTATPEGNLNKTQRQNSKVKEERTPNRHRFGQKLEDIGRKMDENTKIESEISKKEPLVKTEYRDKLLEEMNEKLDSSARTGSSKKDKVKKTAVDNDIYDFQCNEDDSWISLLDDKENEYPRKQRPVLSDPSDVFGDGTTTNRDEVDGYIDATLDIPEINNEKGDLPYSYKLVSVVSHMGISSSTGHYISDVYDIKKRGWFSFDDSHVSKITESEVMSKRERSGYIFFYMSKDIFDDLCLHQSIVTSERKKDS